MNTTTYVIPIRFLNLAINDEVTGLEEPYFSWDNDVEEIGGTVVEIQWVGN